jgi:2-polyprenyl-3-methyl-5-hydroxy-6-metoxy-1,4-benzoquinol methylase
MNVARTAIGRNESDAEISGLEARRETLTRAGYLLDNAWHRAWERLVLQEQFADPATQRRIAALGSMCAWHCLEVGAGAGSIAQWLCTRVGRDGRVLAIDLDIRFLSHLREPALQVCQADVIADELPESAFDLVHVRLLLVHLPQREAVLRKLVHSLKPGGWLLLEERELAPIRHVTTPSYAAAWAALEAVMRAGGVDPAWAHEMPNLLKREGLVDVGAEGEFPLITGGSPMARVFYITWEQMRERMVASGLIDNDDLTRAMQSLLHTTDWLVAPPMFAAWGRRPSE